MGWKGGASYSQGPIPISRLTALKLPAHLGLKPLRVCSCGPPRPGRRLSPSSQHPNYGLKHPNFAGRRPRLPTGDATHPALLILPVLHGVGPPADALYAASLTNLLLPSPLQFFTSGPVDRHRYWLCTCHESLLAKAYTRRLARVFRIRLCGSAHHPGPAGRCVRVPELCADRCRDGLGVSAMLACVLISDGSGSGEPVVLKEDQALKSHPPPLPAGPKVHIHCLTSPS